MVALGKMVNDSDRNSCPKIQRYQMIRILSFFGFIGFLIMSVLDLGDWLINASYGSIPAPNSLFVGGRQSKVIATLAYFRSQFPYFVATLAMWTTFFRIHRISYLETLLYRIGLQISLTSIGGREKPFLAKNRRMKPAIFSVVSLAFLLSFRLVTYIHETINSDVQHKTMAAYFIWQLPAEQFIILLTCMIAAEAVILPLYLWTFSLVTKAATIIETYNAMLECFGSYAKNTCVNYKVKEYVIVLCKVENLIADVVDWVDRSLRTLFGLFLLGSALELASIISSCFFILSGQSTARTPLDYALLVAGIAGPLLATAATIFCASAVYEEVVRRDGYG